MSFMAHIRILKRLLEVYERGRIAISIDEIKERVRVPRDVLLHYLKELERRGIVQVNDDELFILVPSVELAYHAISMGADIEEVALYLNWRDFERFTAMCLMENGYEVIEHLIFKSERRRYEVDVIGLRRPWAIVVDCKHWTMMRGSRSSKLKRAIVDHRRRTEALARCLPRLRKRLGITRWHEVILIPVLVTLYQEGVMLFEGVPLVPICGLNEFLQEFQGIAESIFLKKVPLNTLI